MSSVGTFSLDQDGYFCRDGRRFIPVGVNYWPASCGVEMWQEFPEREIQHDLDVVRDLKLNCVRFFLRWQDFETEPGQIDSGMVDRLRRFMEWCEQREILMQPTLFVGWMSGGLFWPTWKAGRNLFADPAMLEQSVVFAENATRTIREFRSSVLTVDLGNELGCLEESRQAAPAQVARWSRQVSDAIRTAMPGALVMSGCAQDQVVCDWGWRFSAEMGLDLWSMHSYPIPCWHPVDFDGLDDPLGQSLLPFYTRFARTFGPVMVQEFGTIATLEPSLCRRHLEAVLPGCWEAGANGFLWWCLRDITASCHPYAKAPFEQRLGLVDANDTLKPGIDYFIEFSRALQAESIPDRSRAELGVYLPTHYYHRDAPLNQANEPQRTGAWMILAHHMLAPGPQKVAIIRGGQPFPEEIKVLVIAGAVLDEHEMRTLEHWVRAGGKLIWHGPFYTGWGGAQDRLVGAQLIDFRSIGDGVKAELFGRNWTFKSMLGPLVELRPVDADVLARDARGIPLVLRHAVGRGVVVTALPFIEGDVHRVSGSPKARDDWRAWYTGVLAEVGHA